MAAGQDRLVDVLKRFASTMSEHFDVSDVLYGLTDHAVEVLGAACAGVSLASDDGRSLAFVTSSDESATELEIVQQQTRQGPCFRAFETGQPSVIVDISRHDEWPTYQETAAHVGLRSVIGIPMTLNDRRLGAVNIYSRQRRDWTDDEVETALVLANIATSYVIHASRIAEAQRLNEQLRRALESRIIIEQAKGILAGELGLDLHASFDLLRKHARSNQAPLHEVAHAVVNLGLRPVQPPPRDG